MKRDGRDFYSFSPIKLDAFTDEGGDPGETADGNRVR
jgi:hypothetical protein